MDLVDNKKSRTGNRITPWEVVIAPPRLPLSLVGYGAPMEDDLEYLDDYKTAARRHITFRDKILEQDVIWYDAKGYEHAVALMDREYALNVLTFLHDRLGTYIGYKPLTQALRARILSKPTLRERLGL
jgi:hypothetical protein